MYCICDICGAIEERILSQDSFLGTKVNEYFVPDKSKQGKRLCTFCMPQFFADGTSNPNYKYAEGKQYRKHITEVLKQADVMKKITNYDNKKNYRLTMINYLKHKNLL